MKLSDYKLKIVLLEDYKSKSFWIPSGTEGEIIADIEFGQSILFSSSKKYDGTNGVGIVFPPNQWNRIKFKL